MKKTERQDKNSVVESHGQTDGIEHKVINFYHKASTMEEVLNNHTIKMSWTTGATLLSITLELSLLAHENSGHGSRDRGYVWSQQNALPFTKESVATNASQYLTSVNPLT